MFTFEKHSLYALGEQNRIVRKLNSEKGKREIQQWMYLINIKEQGVRFMIKAPSFSRSKMF